MAVFHSDAANTAGKDCGELVAAYIECLYFTDTGDGEQPSSEAKLSGDAFASCVEDCEAFQRGHAALIARAIARPGYSLARCAHDFWYTRNGHGVGFWDRDELPRKLRDALTKAAQDAGNVDTYEGDDGKIYLG